jgi:hypothetical protein
LTGNLQSPIGVNQFNRIVRESTRQGLSDHFLEEQFVDLLQRDASKGRAGEHSPELGAGTGAILKTRA